ncbi:MULTISPECIES: hypothetical protein [Bacillus]|uniref:Lipoprotein n=3 Tax=Bacillus thuringiensis TaxID=1428 RepID=A0AAP4V294_BACTU|nr:MULTISPECIES: hypothetical protein [Bacillus]ERI00942.1 hypothetical protein BTCBT_002497 [Bacillus thuringiensis T01-328]AFV21880.1 NADH dehydrogenase subunit 5 [Bacillus thuringiensis Bt407]MDF9599366.1 hypothetical protein [Bacillus cereus]MDG1589698.1 hypothetical protein [Bacillus cereus]MDN7078464.1 hypothetical protein [Bacillus thuringiensis]
MKCKRFIYVILSTFFCMFLLSACDPPDTEPQLKIEKDNNTHEEKEQENDQFTIKKINDHIKILTDKEREEEYIIYYSSTDNKFTMTHREGQKK